MKNKKWKEFEKLTEECYSEMIQAQGDLECWHKAFDTLKEVIADERARQPEFGSELYQLDDDTDFAYDIQGWLEDYIDDMDMHGAYEKLLAVCDDLLSLFRWEEDKPSDIKFMKSSVLRSLGRKEEAVAFCRQWLEEEPDNIFAVVANIYADIAIDDMEGAEKLIKQHIQEETPCTEENDIIFIAASAYYKVAGKKEELKRNEEKIEVYDQYLKENFLGDDDDAFLLDDDFLPFN